MFKEWAFYYFKKKLVLYTYPLIAVLAISTPSHSQTSENKFNNQRFTTVVVTESIVATAGLIGLHYLWYKKFPRSRFHLFNDNAEWLNMDKIGHATTAYNMSAIQYDMMRWSGLNNNKAALVGGLTSIGLQTIVEIFDGYSQGWGFSKGDMLANILGSTLFMGQQFAWGEQRMRLKFSFHKTIYAKYNPAELGANKWQSWLKDYNGQTYWLSINPASFMKANTDFPSWFNVAVGYSADGMIGAKVNPAKIGNTIIPEFKRSTKILFSIDADLKRFNNTQAPQTLLSIPSLVKLPAPALEFKKDSATKFHWLYF
jgi:uncharacterized protein YfiM (DUF2279 family)